MRLKTWLIVFTVTLPLTVAGSGGFVTRIPVPNLVVEGVSTAAASCLRAVAPMDLVCILLIAGSIWAAVWLEIRRRRCPVRHLARKGCAPNEIAKRTRLSQDAIRSLLDPGNDAFPRCRKGRSFRPARISEGRERAARAGRRETAGAGTV